MSNRNFSCIIALLTLATDAHGKLVIAAVLARSAYGKYVIAAVGDSVTAGDHGLPPFANEDEGNYPFLLQGLLDAQAPGRYEVVNLGLFGATAMNGTNRPYRESKYWPQLEALPFDLAIVTLGTNDAKLDFWESPAFGVRKFETDYGALLTDIVAMRPDATVLAGYPVPYACPLLKCKGDWGRDTAIINQQLQQATNRVAERVGLVEEVDFFEVLGGRSVAGVLRLHHLVGSMACGLRVGSMAWGLFHAHAGRRNKISSATRSIRTTRATRSWARRRSMPFCP